MKDQLKTIDWPKHLKAISNPLNDKFWEIRIDGQICFFQKKRLFKTEGHAKNSIIKALEQTIYFSEGKAEFYKFKGLEPVHPVSGLNYETLESIIKTSDKITRTDIKDLVNHYISLGIIEINQVI